MTELWKLEEVPVRSVWKHEQYDFSDWLSKHVNELWDELSLSLTDVETEKFVWNYRCDILCKDGTTDKTVLIENQFEETNHDHLWKLITYASWLDASIVVWVVEKAREEHRSAIEWLNKHTDNDVAFFLVEIHAYKIWDSKPAPKFVIIEQPNDFIITTKITARWDLKPRQVNRLEFWNQFKEVLNNKWKPFNISKPSIESWSTIATWNSWCQIAIDLVNREHKIRVGFQVKDDKDFFDTLYENKDEIEKRIKTKLEWKRMDDKKVSIIQTTIKWLDFDNQSNYPELMDQCIDNVLLLKEAFKPYL